MKRHDDIKHGGQIEQPSAGTRNGAPESSCQGKCEDCKNKKAESAEKPKCKVALVSMLTLLSFVSYGQSGSVSPSFANDPFNHPMLPAYFTLALIAVTILLLVVVIIYLLKTLNLMSKLEAERTGKPYVSQPSWFVRTWERLNATVPVAMEADIDMGHDFDGIRELDNHLPPWWKGLFYVTVVWGVVYLLAYHVVPILPLQTEEYANELASAEAEARAIAASRPRAVIDENTLVFDNNEEIISRGKIVFGSNNCGSCHRQDGGGNAIGPNLTDDHWIHGGAVKNIFLTIKDGAVEKGMPAWGKVMTPEDVKSVAFFVMSLRGTNPPDAKGPQGELYVPEQATPSDTTMVRASLD